MSFSRVIGAIFTQVGLICILGCGGSGPIENANVLVDLGKDEKALEILDEAIKNNPRNFDAYLLKGKVLVRANAMDLAEDAFSDAIAVGGRSIASKIDKIVLNEFQNSLDSAFPPKGQNDRLEIERAFRILELLNLDDSKENALKWVLDFFVEEEEQYEDYYVGVEYVFKRTVDLEDDIVDREFASAVSALTKRARVHEGAFTVAKALVHRVEPQKIRDEITKKLRRLSDDPELFNDPQQPSQPVNGVGPNDEATARTADSLISLGNRCFDNQQWEDARVSYEKALETAPGNVNVITDLAVVYRNLDQQERAIELLDDAIEQNPKHWQAWLNRVVILHFDLNMRYQAIESLEVLEELAVDNTQIPDLSGLSSEVRGS